MMDADPHGFVGRAGAKLDAALAAFRIDVRGAVCADLGANVGGFTDCLLRRGAARVYAVDTGYGQLAWRLRRDGRVVVMERTNALHAAAPEPVDWAVADVGWTPQALIVPAAMRWLRGAGRGGVVSLLKPHYELAKLQGRRPHAPLSDEQADAVCRDVCRRLQQLGAAVVAVMRSPLRGKGGNAEYLLHVAGPRAAAGRRDDRGGRLVDRTTTRR
jgi:23S rRNA (cytidine1920-2'-O)/16S rRNA (cytidine1409-2'-O)-methyltransferase